MPNFSDTTLEFIDICKEAGSVVKELQSDGLEEGLKENDEIITSADHKSHGIIRSRLKVRFPGITTIMEEQENPLVLPETYITCDELDGSIIYSRGMSEWGIALAFIERGEPTAGVITLPALDTIIVAEKGKGAWINGHPVRLSPEATLGKGIVGIEINRYLDDRHFEWVKSISRSCAGVRGLGVTAGNLLDLLRGHTSVFINMKGAKIWDFAAGYVAVKEADGVALDCDGNALLWDRIPVSAVMGHNRRIVEEVLNLNWID